MFARTALATCQSRSASSRDCSKLWSSACRPVNFQRSDQGRSQPDREIDQPPGPLNCRVDTDQPSPRILQGEVRLADLQQHVIPRGLHIRFARGDDPPLRRAVHKPHR